MLLNCDFLADLPLFVLYVNSCMFLCTIAYAFNALNLPLIFKYYYTENDNCLILNYCSFFTFVILLMFVGK